MLFLLLVVSVVSACSPGTPFFPKKWVEWAEERVTLPTSTSSIESPPPELPTPAPLTAPLTWKQIAVQQNSLKPAADSFIDIYRRLEQQNRQHLVAVEPEGQRPPWIIQ